MAIKCVLSTIMGAKRLKMTDVAQGAGIARSTVFGLYHDRVKKVDYAVLDRLCKFLNCQPGDLLIYVPDAEQG
ncbi:MAG TPA: XRE family transcriptional regulator [Peptococcaceae bacterium]|nr:MAG: Transcriptional regulator, Cro/CI family [Moorella sp. 60_41]HBT46658.1 XRE family transcriptional regulator [Peptococcaceae bacterium]